MANNRVIYQSDALYVSREIKSTGADDHLQLRRVQSANYSLTVNRQDVNQFGQLSRIEAIILESPSVSFDTSYLLGDGFNEQALNFQNSPKFETGFVRGQIESTSGTNLYIISAKEGQDINTTSVDSTNFSSVGIGNAFLTDYTVEASVGSIPTVTVSFEGTNMNGTAGISGGAGGFTGISGAGIDPIAGTPFSTFLASGAGGDDGATTPFAGNRTGVILPAPSAGLSAGTIPTALRPGDIELSFANADGDSITNIAGGSDGAHVQSVSLSVPLSRTPIERLGSRFAYARVVDFPIVPTLSVSAIVNETQTNSLTDIINDDAFISELQFTFKDSDGSNTPRASYKLKNVKLDSESFSSSIGPNKAIDLSFSVSIGGPTDTTNNVFFSGSNATTVFEGFTKGPTDYVT
jgi:hypothetical protein